MTPSMVIAILALLSLVVIYILAVGAAEKRIEQLERLGEEYDGLTVEPEASRLIHGTIEGLTVEVRTESVDHDHDEGGLTHLRVELPDGFPDDLIIGPAGEAPDRAVVFENDRVLTDDYALWRPVGEPPDSLTDLAEAFRAIVLPNTSDFGFQEGRLQTTVRTSMVPAPQLRKMLEAMVAITHRLAQREELS